jgi:hypothetical protein
MFIAAVGNQRASIGAENGTNPRATLRVGRVRTMGGSTRSPVTTFHTPATPSLPIVTSRHPSGWNEAESAEGVFDWRTGGFPFAVS